MSDCQSWAESYRMDCELPEGHDGPHRYVFEWEDGEPWEQPTPCTHTHPIERVSIGTGAKSMYCVYCGESWT